MTEVRFKSSPLWLLMQMRTIERIFIAAVMLVSVLSCKKEEMLYVSVTDLSFTSSVSSHEFDISADGNWNVTSPEWLTCTPSSGSGNAKINVSVKDESFGLDLSGTIVIAGKDMQVNVNVSQKGVTFSIDPVVFDFDVSGTPITAAVISQTPWKITDAEKVPWLDITPISGQTGRTFVKFAPKPITDRTPRTRQFITLDYGKSFMILTISQTMPNSNPDKAVLLEPQENAEDVKINTIFSWKGARDPDGDNVSYRLMVSKDDGNTWSSFETDDTKAKLSYMLDKNTPYLWKVQSYDILGGLSESKTQKFTTGEGGAHAEGEVMLIQSEMAGAPRPVHLVIVGDGFIEEDYYEGGAFDQAVETAVEAFFTPEPYATYRDYFRISAVAAYSEERGATVLKDMSGCKAQRRNTIFEATLEGGNSTGTSCNYDRVFSYAKKVPGVTDDVLKNTTVLVLINLDVYAGTCLMEMTGRSVSMCPMGKSSFRTVVMHEGGGHGYGRLSDEYRYYSEPLPNDKKSQVEYWRQVDQYYAYNISFTGDPAQVHWKDYFTWSGYDAVSLFEGGMLYSRGVWRPEYISCMEDNRPYYNAPSREAIVRRIMRGSGKQFSIDEFLAKDFVRSDNTVAERLGFTPADFIPLAPPILIDK